MPHIHQIIASPRAQVLTEITLFALWLFFAVAHLSTFSVSGRESLLVFGFAETATAVLFLARTQPRTLSTIPHEWVIAFLGTFLPLLLRPTTDRPPQVTELGLMIGSAIQIAGVLSLNRSFALIPALRELKTNGMYRFVRHPIYFSYLITFSCYLAANFSIRNSVILLSSIGLLIARVHFEERHLGVNSEYRAYQSRVRWRLIPFVF